MEFGKDFNKNEDQLLELVRKGMNLQRGKDFWDDFLSLCANADAIANLLDVPKEKITALSGKINKLKSGIDISKEKNKKDRLLKTGDKL
jgi:hypothetical protein